MQEAAKSSALVNFLRDGKTVLVWCRSALTADEIDIAVLFAALWIYERSGSGGL